MDHNISLDSHLNFRLKAEDVSEIKSLADTFGMSVSALMRDWVRNCIQLERRYIAEVKAGKVPTLMCIPPELREAA